jgi:hypothetical protein
MADRVLPAAVLWFLFWPLSAVRATRAQRNDLDRRAPLSHLPPGPGDRMPSRLARWRFHF